MFWTVVGCILFGAFAGWIAGKLMKSDGGFWRNALLGIAGSLVGGIFASLLGLPGGLPVELAVAVAGACIVLTLARFFTKR